MRASDQSLDQQGKPDHEITQTACPFRDTAWLSSSKRGPILFPPVTSSFIIMRSNNISIIHHPKICWNDLWNMLKWFLFLKPFIKEGEANFTWIRSIIVTKYNEPFFYEVQPKHGVTLLGNEWHLKPQEQKKNFRWNFCKGKNGQLSDPVVLCWNPLPPTLGRLNVNDPSLKGEVRLFICCWVFNWKTAWQEAWNRTHTNARAPWPWWHGEHWEEDHQEGFCTSSWII